MIFKYTIICLMALIVLFVIHLLIINLNFFEAVSQDADEAQKVPQGLYNATDKVALLTVHNFNENVYNSSSAWLVQFYNSWCGHCKRFAPIWKQLAASIYNWQDVILIGVIDCADEVNTEICGKYQAQKKPTVRIFPPFLQEFNLGKNVSKPRENFDPALWRSEIIQHLQNYSRPPHWPDLSPVDSDTIEEASKLGNGRPLILVLEKDESFLGREITLDLLSVENVTVRYSFDQKLSNNEERFPQVFVFNPDKEQLPLTNTTRHGVFTTIRNYLLTKGYNVPNIVEMEAKPSPAIKVKQSINQLLTVNKVFADDLESAVRFTLFQEVSGRTEISGKTMEALKNFLQVLRKYFPSNPNVHSLLNDAFDGINGASSITGADFKKLLIDRPEKSAPLKNQNWVGCKGSVANYRGYTCSLWMTFHTLSVQAYVSQESSNGSTEVLNAVTEYIRNFFGCEDCSDHFLEMSKTIAGNVTSLKDSVLWLWKAHNSVNNRIAGDSTEDPAYPKQQFPVKSMCPKCRQSDDSWNEEEVLSYLKNMYTNIYNGTVLPSGKIIAIK